MAVLLVAMLLWVYFFFVQKLLGVFPLFDLRCLLQKERRSHLYLHLSLLELVLEPYQIFRLFPCLFCHKFLVTRALPFYLVAKIIASNLRINKADITSILNYFY